MRSLLWLAALLLSAPGPLVAGMVWTPGGGHAVSVVSLKEARFHRVTRQQHDYSCGAASVATLLTYHYDDPVSEADVVNGMLAGADRAVVEQQGFSMLDMKRFLQDRGYPAEGFRAGLDALQASAVPTIALVEVDGYRHFVVVQGLSEHEVLVGDPALGIRVYQRREFDEIWNGLFLVIMDHIELARGSFNDPTTWRVLTRPPLGTALQQPGLGGFTLSLPRSGDF